MWHPPYVSPSDELYVTASRNFTLKITDPNTQRLRFKYNEGMTPAPSQVDSSTPS